MKCIVQKYGGSSVADADKIKKIAQKVAEVKKQGYNVAVVVSAMGKTTNNLIDLARSLSPKPERREMDMLLSTGERTTMSLLCIALQELGIDAISLTGSQSGIITNDRHNDAQVIEVRPFRVQDEMAKGKVVVIGGFQGVSYRRDITTLGRGGSDTTAVALAAALDAERCEIYSDVDGVYTADPAVVADAKHLPELSYPVMQEMAAAGAKVLNAQAVQFAKEKNIAIYARSTFVGGKETIVRKIPAGSISGVQAVVSENDITRLRIHSEKALPLFRETLRYLEKEQVPIKEVNVMAVESDPAQSKASLVISAQSVYGWEEIRKTLEQRLGAAVAFDTHLSALSLIGEGINRNNLTLLETVDLLQLNGIVPNHIVTTSFRISLLMNREAIQEGVRLCHRKWITGLV
ncbi:MAG: aspartate kinase [Desulfobacteraceae bacterium]|nr:MAG: aspartate kinase [Desulfobacteraceae bacterium]